MPEDVRPLILVTNDDGIAAEGIAVLATHLEPLGDVIVVAPDQEQSAVGHGISLTRPMRIDTRSPNRHAVSGSPVDSVIVGLFHLCPRQPDLVISGINLGPNLGTDVFYSGTVAGALEGAIQGLPAIAVSQDLGARDAAAPGLSEMLERTASFTAEMASEILQRSLPPKTALSINAPANLTREYCWARMGRRVYREKVEQRLDLRGVPYYWIGGPVIRNVSGPGTDAHAVEAGLISLTLLTLDLTADLPDRYRSMDLAGYQRVPASSG